MPSTPIVLSLTSSAAISTYKISGQPRAQVASDFNPVSTLCGYRVSRAEVLLEDGFLARWVA